MNQRERLGMGVVASFVLASAAGLCGCAGRGDIAHRDDTDTVPASLGETEAREGTTDPLPPGWSQSPDGTLTVPRERARFSVPPAMVRLSGRVAITDVTLGNTGHVQGFTVRNAGIEAGTYEVTSVTMDATGRVKSMQMRDPNATTTTDCCWMTVISRPNGDTFSCTGSCTTQGMICAVQFQGVGDDTTFWCQCISESDPG